jgi:hypothetical protein
VAVAGGRSWQLIDCAPVDPQGPGGVKALQALKQHLSDVLEVMLPAFGECRLQSRAELLGSAGRDVAHATTAAASCPAGHAWVTCGQHVSQLERQLLA